MLSLVHVLEWRAAVHPDLVALSDHAGLELTYAELAGAMSRSAAGFSAAGVAPGDVVPVVARNQAGWVSLGWEVRLGERGEVQVRGAAPLPGYWNDVDATRRSLTADGFYRTGDVGTIDADGYLTIVDRLNDLVITGGENVFPAEVEAVLAEHPSVADVAVIGVPHERWGETVHAIVVAAPGDDLDTGGLVGWARERLAGFKCPTGVTVVPELPRNATGKVLRAALREPFWAGRNRMVS